MDRTREYSFFFPADQTGSGPEPNHYRQRIKKEGDHHRGDDARRGQSRRSGRSMPVTPASTSDVPFPELLSGLKKDRSQGGFAMRESLPRGTDASRMLSTLKIADQALFGLPVPDEIASRVASPLSWTRLARGGAPCRFRQISADGRFGAVPLRRAACRRFGPAAESQRRNGSRSQRHRLSSSRLPPEPGRNLRLRTGDRCAKGGPRVWAPFRSVPRGVRPRPAISARRWLPRRACRCGAWREFG